MENAEKATPLFGSVGGSHWLGRFTDQSEGFGPQVVEDLVSGLKDLGVVVDLGAGAGRDLGIVRKHHPRARLIAIEGGRDFASRLAGKADDVYVADIEREPLPLADGQADLIMANQVLEHTKEVFWIFHQVTRSLKLGGHLLIGVPNICSLHNRFLLMMGKQPTQHKVCSAHVRPFSKSDTLAFLDACFPGGYELVQFRGAQFYPFPKPVRGCLRAHSRPLRTRYSSSSGRSQTIGMSLSLIRCGRVFRQTSGREMLAPILNIGGGKKTLAFAGELSGSRSSAHEPSEALG